MISPKKKCSLACCFVNVIHHCIIVLEGIIISASFQKVVCLCLQSRRWDWLNSFASVCCAYLVGESKLCCASLIRSCTIWSFIFVFQLPIVWLPSCNCRSIVSECVCVCACVCFVWVCVRCFMRVCMRAYSVCVWVCAERAFESSD